MNKTPLRNLFRSKNVITGIDNSGKKSFFHRGGGIRFFYVFNDLSRFFFYVPGLVVNLFFDAMRNRVLSLVVFSNGFCAYIIATAMVSINQWIYFGKFVPRILGAMTSLSSVPRGRNVFSLTLTTNGKAVMARSPGVSCQVLKKYSNYALVRLPSGEERLFASDNRAVLGASFKYLSFLNRKFTAGYNRRRGFRPVTRGVAMNPVDHPHGGGEGRTSGGQPSVSPWGVYTKGKRTRTLGHKNRRAIVRSRIRGFEK